MFYRNSSLVELELAFCRVYPQRRIEWRGLTRLDFLGVELGENVIEIILSGCPVLYSMGLQDCLGFNRLNINSPSVGKLAVWVGEDVHLPYLEISAPYLHYLEISSFREIDDVDDRKILVRNIPCVVKALIDISHVEDWSWSYAMDWIEATLHISELHLTEDLIELIAAMVASGEQIPQSHKRVSLTLRTGEGVLNKVSIFGLIRLLESSPQLEKLEVFTSLQPPCYDMLRNDDFSCCDYPHLKTVKIECAKHEKPLFADLVILLARILLRRATALEKMLFLVNYRRASSGFKKIEGVLNSYPRSSKQAQVLVLPLC